MDALRRIQMDEVEELQIRQRLALVGAGALDKADTVVPFASVGPATDGAAGKPAAMTDIEVRRAFEMVQDAAKKLRSSDDRVRDAEARSHAIVHRAADELKAAEARIHAAEAQTRITEARAETAERRVVELEAWLRQIFSTISEELPVRA